MLKSDAKITINCEPYEWIEGKWECPFCEYANKGDIFRLGKESASDSFINCSNCHKRINVYWTTEKRCLNVK